MDLSVPATSFFYPPRVGELSAFNGFAQCFGLDAQLGRSFLAGMPGIEQVLGFFEYFGCHHCGSPHFAGAVKGFAAFFAVLLCGAFHAALGYPKGSRDLGLGTLA